MGVERPAKRVKKQDARTPAYKFTTASDIRKALRVTDPESLTETLKALRNQLTIRDDATISPQDERLLLAQAWLELDPGAQDLFSVWDRTTDRQMTLISLVVSVLSCLTSLLSSHYSYHSTCQPVVQNVLSQQWSNRLNAYLAGNHSELILMTLKLYNGLSAFAGGKERKNLLDGFYWEMKSLTKLLFMRRKVKSDETVDPLARPDIRTLFILFLLSFVHQTSSTLVKVSFLEQHRDILSSVFKGLAQDPYPVAKKIFETCWTGIWSDAKIKRTLKIQLFNEATIAQITKLYSRSSSEGSETEQIPADLVHHFLLAICTHPSSGLCFRDRGWYPRDTDATTADLNEVENSSAKTGKIYNKILANVLKTLQVNEDPRQQELALKILRACPELVAGYWQAVALTLEPRLSSKWLANVAFLGTVVALPVPIWTFIHQDSGLHQSTPPPLHNIIENILPTSSIKAHLSKGLQSLSPLVQHCSALVLAKCLKKLHDVLAAFRTVEDALEENEEDGQWKRRHREVELEARRRTPDFQVVLAFSQQVSSSVPTTPEQRTRFALLSEVAQRLLWLYQTCLPGVISEARFDVGKTLHHFADSRETLEQEKANRLHTLRRIHVLAFLRDSDQFNVCAKPAPSSPSNLRALLKEYVTTSYSAVLFGVLSLLKHQLSETLLFQHNPEEVELWLRVLPQTKRAADAKAPDGTPLTDEGESVIAFLDECVQRCLKTPYRYLEDAEKLAGDARRASNELEGAEHVDTFVSPLLMTVLEQLSAKVAGTLLTPSDILALASFLRKLVFGLATEGVTIGFLDAFARAVDGALAEERLKSTCKLLRGAIRYEVELLHTYVQRFQGTPDLASHGRLAFEEPMDGISELVDQTMESQKKPEDIAHELIDLLRLCGASLSNERLQAMHEHITEGHPAVVSLFIETLDPSHGNVWDIGSSDDQIDSVDFACLIIQATAYQLHDKRTQRLLSTSLQHPAGRSLPDLKRACRAILARYPLASQDAADLGVTLLLLLKDLLLQTEQQSSPRDFTSLKTFLFAEHPVLMGWRTLPPPSNSVRTALQSLVSAVFKPEDENDKRIAVDHFSHLYSAEGSAGNSTTLSLLVTWSTYAGINHQLSLLQKIEQSGFPPEIADPVHVLLRAIEVSSHRPEALQELGAHANILLAAGQAYHGHEAISRTIETIMVQVVTASLPTGHCGQPPSFGLAEVRSLSDECASAETRWNQRTQKMDLELLTGTQFEDTTSTARLEVASNLAYRNTTLTSGLVNWVKAHAETDETAQLANVVYTVADISCLRNELIDLGPALPTAVKSLARTAFDHKRSPDLRALSGKALMRLLQAPANDASAIAKTIQKLASKLPVDRITSETVAIARTLRVVKSTDFHDAADSLTDHALGWVVRYYAENLPETEDTIRSILELPRLFAGSPTLKAPLVEPVFTATIQHCLSNKFALRLLLPLLTSTSLKPASVNRHLQSIVQHAHFAKLCHPGLSGNNSPRDELIDILHKMFHLHPANTCQPSHIHPLIAIYGGTLSLADRKILEIMRLFERQRNSSVAALLSQWSISPEAPSQNALAAVRSLEPARMLRTCLAYPSWLRLEDSALENHQEADQLYNPLFAILLFGHALEELRDAAGMVWVEVFRTNVVSVLLRTLSSKCDGLRELALGQLGRLCQALETADMQEQPLVLYLLTLLQNLIPSPAPPMPPRLPTYTSLFLAHALRSIFHPQSFLYPHTARFLLQRPTLDAGDVPLLFGLLYASGEDWKRERAWMVRYLGEGMLGGRGVEWRVVKRRRTWECVASLVQSEDKDRGLRQGGLEFLLNLTSNRQAATSLVLKSALLSWIETQLLTLRSEESALWLRILENLTVVLDPSKTEKATQGEWRNSIGRCICLVLQGPVPADLLALVCPLILRLSLLFGPSSYHLAPAIALATHALSALETKLELSSASHTSLALYCLRTPTDAHTSLPPHTTSTLHLAKPEAGLGTWGACVEALWRAAMSLEEKCEEWGALTARLLLWRTLVGEEGSMVGEWARREVVQNLVRETID